MEEGQSRPVARYPDSVTAGILMVYLIIVRPLETTVVQLLQECQPITEAEQNEEQLGDFPPPRPSPPIGTTHRDYLFVSRGNPHSIDRLRYWFEKTMNTIGIGIRTSQYRQYHSGVVKNFLGAIEDTDIDRPGSLPVTTMLHNQAGHSEQTAHQIYGVSSLDMRNLTGTQMEGFRQASHSWHNAIGMIHGRPCPSDDAVSQSRPQSFTADNPPVVTDMGEVLLRLDRMEHAMHDFFKQMTDRMRSAAQAGLAIECGTPRKKLRSEKPSNSLPGLKNQMRVFLDTQTAEFRSKEQQEAVVHSIAAEKDALIVLPTGGGKSLTFMLSAFVHEEKCIVVIVPLVALQKYLMNRCQEAGLQAST